MEYHKADIQEPAFRIPLYLGRRALPEQADVANTYVLNCNHITTALYYQ